MNKTPIPFVFSLPVVLSRPKPQNRHPKPVKPKTPIKISLSLAHLPSSSSPESPPLLLVGAWSELAGATVRVFCLSSILSLLLLMLFAASFAGAACLPAHIFLLCSLLSRWSPRSPEFPLVGTVDVSFSLSSSISCRCCYSWWWLLVCCCCFVRGCCSDRSSLLMLLCRCCWVPICSCLAIFPLEF